MQNESLLQLIGGNHHVGDLMKVQPRLFYTHDEQQLNLFIQRELDRLLVGGTNQLLLLKLYPMGADGSAVSGDWPGITRSGVRWEIAEQIAADALNFFGPLHGGVTTQEVIQEIILQERKFTTAYPHIILERYECYDDHTSEPLLGAWRACRIQNQRRETQTNRLIDIALLGLEVSKSVFPLLLR